ncbi:MAG TPA: response regulator transcription factor [Microlunatus sp.]|nr:response regulator transcription factor [Microlunatus sp.]
MTPPGGSHVLVVDDDDGIREMLQSSLSFAGFRVTTAPDAQTALTLFGTDDPDAIVLDVMMPGIDGFDFLQLLRHRGETLPVLFLSARDTVEDRIRGLRLGADDYLTKPFSVVEVTVRLEGLLRRSRLERDLAHGSPSAGAGGVLRCGDLEVDEDRHLTHRGGRSVDLSPTEFRLLVYLLLHQGRVLSKAQILDQLWQYDFGGDSNVVERFVSNLRRKIDVDPPPLIHTVRGFGYTIRAPEEPA